MLAYAGMVDRFAKHGCRWATAQGRGRCLAALALLAGVLPAPPALAQLGPPQACPEPRAPACVTRPYTYDDARRVARCQRRLDTYLEEVQAYRACLLERAQARAGEAQDKADALLAEFTCRRQGKDFC